MTVVPPTHSSIHPFCVVSMRSNLFSHRFSLSLIAPLSFYSEIIRKVNPHCEHVDLLCIFPRSQYPFNFAGRSRAARVLHTDSQTWSMWSKCYWFPLCSQTFHLGGLPVTSVTETVPLVVAGIRQSDLALMDFCLSWGCRWGGLTCGDLGRMPWRRATATSGWAGHAAMQ